MQGAGLPPLTAEELFPARLFPSGVLRLLRETPQTVVLSHQIHRNTSRRVDVLRAISPAHAKCVLAKADVEHPEDAVFNASARPNRFAVEPYLRSVGVLPSPA